VARRDSPTLFLDDANRFQPHTDSTPDLFGLRDSVALQNEPQASCKFIVDRKREKLSDAR
jgi:hypothetical protein